MKYDIYIVLSGRIVQIVMMVVSLKIMTYRLSPAEMGKYAIIMAIISFFAMVFINPVGMYINRQLNDWNKKGEVWHNFQHAALYLITIVLAAMCLMPVILYCVGLKTGLSLRWLVLLVTTNLLFNTINQTIIPSLNMLGKRFAWAIFTTVTLLASLVFSVVMTISAATAELWISGQIIGLLIGVSLAIPFFQKNLIKRAKSKPFCSWHEHVVKPVITFALPIAITVTLNWIQFQSYRFGINYFNGIDFLGFFAAGYSISAGIMGAFEVTAMNYFYPAFYQKIDGVDHEKRMDVWCRYAKVMLCLTIYTATFVIFISTQLAHVLLASQYWTAVPFVVLGVFVESGRIIGNVYSLAAHAEMNTKLLIFPQLIGALLVALLVPIMLHVLPEHGLSIALIVSSITYVVMMHFMVANKLGARVCFRETFPWLLMAVIAGGGAVVPLLISDGIYSDILSLIVSGGLYLMISHFFLRRNML